MIRYVLATVATLCISAGALLACDTAFDYGDDLFDRGISYANSARDKFNRAADILESDRVSACELLSDSENLYRKAVDEFYGAVNDYTDAVDDCNLDGRRSDARAARENAEISRENQIQFQENQELVRGAWVKFCAG
ncbi:hypothetical protein [uncultured Shimia sp.]|uniref:hypothetical protein n=1 Tax=uncultured Shimia sp. TaxID=573152 RepID=UPI002617049F|nr:hypothetical protein [uncultured Shimia sp.]